MSKMPGDIILVALAKQKQRCVAACENFYKFDLCHGTGSLRDDRGPISGDKRTVQLAQPIDMHFNPDLQPVFGYQRLLRIESEMQLKKRSIQIAETWLIMIERGSWRK